MAALCNIGIGWKKDDPERTWYQFVLWPNCKESAGATRRATPRWVVALNGSSPYREQIKNAILMDGVFYLATSNGLEPSTSSVTGWRANRLHHEAMRSEQEELYQMLCDL